MVHLKWANTFNNKLARYRGVTVLPPSPLALPPPMALTAALERHDGRDGRAVGGRCRCWLMGTMERRAGEL